GYEYGSFHFLEPSFLHNYTDSTSESLRLHMGMKLFYKIKGPLAIGPFIHLIHQINVLERFEQT
ncbi:hypothetical protein ABNC90_19400, partial [Paenibacillus larvae]